MRDIQAGAVVTYSISLIRDFQQKSCAEIKKKSGGERMEDFNFLVKEGKEEKEGFRLEKMRERIEFVVSILVYKLSRKLLI